MFLFSFVLLYSACGWFSSSPIESPQDSNVDTVDGQDQIEFTGEEIEQEEEIVLECTSSEDCDDLEPCNGVEVCLIEGICMAGEPLADGTSCVTHAGVEGACRSEICVPMTCGNGSVDEGEECDDGNDTGGDGCEIDCTFTCHDHAECMDDDICNGDELCTTDEHVCVAGVPPADGVVCEEEPRHICIDGLCEVSFCGDGFVDTGGGESCEPFIDEGCMDNCQWVCEDTTDCPDDGEMCNGEEYCNLELHQCGRRDVPEEGTVCETDPYSICIGLVCQVTDNCGNGVLDPGEECDNGAANSDTLPDACRTDCTNPRCGDGVADSGEACDNTSGFCSAGCDLSAPSADWVECFNSSGTTAFITIESWAGNRTWPEFRDHCRDLIESYSPVDYVFYGYAVFTQQYLWNCIVSDLDTSADYFIGIYQDTTASDYAEPDSGFYWIGYDGASWVNVAAFDASSYFLVSYFNDLGGTGTRAECGYVRWRDHDEWQIYDWPCDLRETWDGICMIQF